MRLTLRTLLAYLDDTLEGDQVKQIGQKVAESDTAQELIARIKQVTRRRRLTTPPASGPGAKLDANTIADYLENKLSEDEVAEVEQISLGSDVHLAELAACHQLLTLILGEQPLIPPTSRQRMYALVKGREAIPFRKARSARGDEAEEKKTSDDHYEMDETLRMGLPAWRKRSSWRSRLALLGGTLAACLLLAAAIYQALHSTSLTNEGQDPNGTVAAVKIKDTAKQPTTVGKPATNSPQTGGADTDNGNKPATGKTNTTKKTTKPMTEPPVKPKPEKPGMPDEPEVPIEPPPVKEPTLMDIPLGKPSEVPVPVGEFKRSDLPGEPEILLQQPKSGIWQQVNVLSPKVYSAARLVSLPGCQNLISLNGDALRLKLIGALPEESPGAGLAREAMVELHQHDKLSLDLTLHRGKIIITNVKDKPAQIRLRFSNPTDPEQGEIWDLLLKEKGTEIFVERNTAIPPGEPFFAGKPKHNDRKGPVAAVHVVVREGPVDLRREKLTYHLQKPPGDARFYWVSTTGVGKEKLGQVPEYASDKTDLVEPKLPDDAKPEVKKQVLEFHKKFLETRQKMKQARIKLVSDLLGNPNKLDTVLKSFVKSEQREDRILAVRCYGAVDRVDELVDALGNKDHTDVRRAAIDTLRRWLSYERDNDYELYKVLIDNSLYSTTDADSLITMLHGFSAKDALTKPAIYEALIPKLDDDKLALRELAGLQLYLELPKFLPQPVGETIEYGPDAPPQVRAAAVKQWRQLLASGKLPPRVN